MFAVQAGAQVHSATKPPNSKNSISTVVVQGSPLPSCTLATMPDALFVDLRGLDVDALVGDEADAIAKALFAELFFEVGAAACRSSAVRAARTCCYPLLVQARLGTTTQTVRSHGNE